MQTGVLAQYVEIQDMQKLCPHGVETGRVNTSRQTGQRSCCSDKKLLLLEAISENKHTNESQIKVNMNSTQP